MKSSPQQRLTGEVRVPGDKSIGHRAFMFSALATGESTVSGVGDGADLASTRAVLGQLGVRIERTGPGTFTVHGTDNFSAISVPLDCGNSGTTLRLMTGLLAGRRGKFTLVGDASLSVRPMQRIANILAPFGATIELPDGNHPPVVVTGRPLHAAQVDTGGSSAQVKSAAMLAALRVRAPSTITEQGPSRDHTERMLTAAGVSIERLGRMTTVHGGPLETMAWRLPGDPSSAAFWLASAALLPGSELTVLDVGLNPTRTGFVDVLRAMGVGVTCHEEGEWGGEPVGRIEVRGGDLHGAEIGGTLALRALDELPLVAVLGSLATGSTRVFDARELRVKESDRVEAMTDGLRALGAHIDSTPDGWVIEGRERLHGGAVEARHDHRIAMALSVAGLRADGAVQLDDPACAAVSYPTFVDDLRARLEAP